MDSNKEEAVRRRKKPRLIVHEDDDLIASDSLPSTAAVSRSEQDEAKLAKYYVASLLAPPSLELFIQELYNLKFRNPVEFDSNVAKVMGYFHWLEVVGTHRLTTD